MPNTLWHYIEVVINKKGPSSSDNKFVLQLKWNIFFVFPAILMFWKEKLDVKLIMLVGTVFSCRMFCKRETKEVHMIIIC